MSGTVKLRKPVEWHKEEVTEVSFREPVGKDLIQCGTPLDMYLPEGDGEELKVARVNAGCIAKLIARCGSSQSGGALGAGFVEKLCIDDFNACQNEILAFFGGPDEAETKTSSTGTTH